MYSISLDAALCSFIHPLNFAPQLLFRLKIFKWMHTALIAFIHRLYPKQNSTWHVAEISIISLYCIHRYVAQKYTSQRVPNRYQQNRGNSSAPRNVLRTILSDREILFLKSFSYLVAPVIPSNEWKVRNWNYGGLSNPHPKGRLEVSSVTRSPDPPS